MRSLGGLIECDVHPVPGGKLSKCPFRRCRERGSPRSDLGSHRVQDAGEARTLEVTGVVATTDRSPA